MAGLFGCYYFKSFRCWTWCGSDTHACSFIHALIWHGTGCSAPAVFVSASEEHMLWAQYSGWQDRKISFYWHTAWQHLIWPQLTDVLLKFPCHMYRSHAQYRWRFHARFTLSWVRLKSLLFDVVVNMLCLNKCNSCQEKKTETEAAAVPLAPYLVLHIFNTAKLKKLLH